MPQNHRWLDKTVLTETRSSGNYQKGFFSSFDSFSDAKSNLKALLVLPIDNLFSTLVYVSKALRNIIYGVMNIVIGAATFNKKELQSGLGFFKTAGLELVAAVYSAVSIITDTLAALLSLMTHSLFTLARGAGKAKDAILDSFTPSEGHRNKC